MISVKTYYFIKVIVMFVAIKAQDYFDYNNPIRNFKGPILSKLTFLGFFHDNRDLGAM